MNQQRLRLLAVFAITLAAIRFFILPWIETQSAARDELSVLTKRLDRATGVIESRQNIEKSLAEIERGVAEVGQRFPVAEGAESFRLQTQQAVRDLATSSEVSQDLFGWVLEGDVDAAGLKYVRARMQFGGDIEMIARMHGNLEARFANMLIREVTVTSPSPIGKDDESYVTMTLVADFHFRPKTGTL
jgi:hypothetical protein